METGITLPVFLLFACLVGLAVALLAIARIFTPRQFVGPIQKMPYESGMDPIHDTRRRFDVRFHLIAIAFLVFDVEVLFLYPWAVASKSDSPAAVASAGGSQSLATTSSSSALVATDRIVNAGIGPDRPQTANAQPEGISSAVKAHMASSRHIVFAGVMVFIAMLTLGFVYDWRKGVFQWR